VVILGGGVGGVTTAYELSRGDWQKRFASITLYQQGWRLGGKGASGRGEHERIEEHGLHIWFGFYENAFRMMRECHEELAKRAQVAVAPAVNPQPRWPLVFDTIEDSFSACHRITLTDHDGCNWRPWVADFFHFQDDCPWLVPDPRTPAEQPDAWSAVFYVTRCMYLAADLVASLVDSSADDPGYTAAATGTPQAVGTVTASGKSVWLVLAAETQAALGAAAEGLDVFASKGAVGTVATGAFDAVLRALDLALDVLRGRLDELIRSSDTLRRLWYLIDLMLAIVRGIIEDGVIEHDDFDVINDVELCDWLRSHGAERETVDCALVRTVVYDLAFAYRGGDPQTPAAEAGTALRGLLRAFFTYRGAMMWKMNAGMGDVVFAPLYELLDKRGVDVQFFHRVEKVSADNGLVESITIDVQADVVSTTKPVEFLLKATSAKGKSSPGAKAVWPAKPHVPLKPSSSTYGKPPVARDYESWLTARSVTKVATKVLTRAKGDFDRVVFAMPIAMVPHVAADLINQSPRWTDAAEHIETVPTQALQLWLNKPASEFSEHEDGAVVGGYVEPYDTWSDMPQLVKHEQVKDSVTVAYFCNVLGDSPIPERGLADHWLKEQDKRVEEHAKRFLRHDIRYLWSNAVDQHSGEFDWSLLVGHYLRANVEPSERYVLSVPGSSAYRIAADDTDFKNLYVAGDWTACGLNVGCVEAATMSGLLAANAMLHDVGAGAQARTIIGYHGP